MVRISLVIVLLLCVFLHACANVEVRAKGEARVDISAGARFQE